MKLRLLLFCIAFSCLWNLLSAQTYSFDFSIDNQQFEGGVSDFGVNQSGQHQFTFDNRDLPSPFPPGQKAQYVSGVNPSDDLFMYMKRKITGLQPLTSYSVFISVEFASIYPTNAIGVGGAPGEGVTMKAGVTLIEPDTLIIQKGGPFVVMNIDKGNQSSPGADMDTIGHVGVNDTTTVYTLKTNDNAGHLFNFTTDASGEAWIVVGTDSGFEATTSLYFTNITYEFAILSDISDPMEEDIKVFPNPSSGLVHIVANDSEFDMINIFDMAGKLYRSYVMRSNDFTVSLPISGYLIQVKSGNSTIIRQIIVQ